MPLHAWWTLEEIIIFSNLMFSHYYQPKIQSLLVLLQKQHNKDPHEFSIKSLSWPNNTTDEEELTYISFAQCLHCFQYLVLQHKLHC